ncbi:MAG: M18 family aminopeptidase [Eubacteriales bacterium]
MYRELSQELFDFIGGSPSCFHVIGNVEAELRGAGFEKLSQAQEWELVQGGKYYITCNQSTIIAWELPENEYKGFHIVASHSDFPTFKVKANPEIKFEKLYTSLSVEKYGGPLMAPWFDRPLSIAGRVVTEENGEIISKNVDFGKDCVSIVNLAIHMNREANNGMSYKVSKDMVPIWAGAKNDVTFMDELAKVAGVNVEDILDMDLYLYNRMEGKIWGANDEFISSTKLDDLQCAFTSMKAFMNVTGQDYVKVLAVFDNEEVGSSTRQGGKSNLLESVLKRIAENQGRTEEGYNIDLANSFLLSADNAHAVHPNYAEKADKTNHPYPNGGVVIKYTASQQYTTDARSGAYVKSMCKKAEVPYQVYFNHSDVVGGSTLGNLAILQVPIMAADVGAAQLAMHSPYETGGVEDTYNLMKLFEEFYKR